MPNEYDAIIIGAGHNGLVTAGYLSRAGLRTLVLESRGMVGGACVAEEISHGEMSVDQLFCLRPVPGWARYRTPIRGFYMCGSGAHPGGGVMGAPGHNAAREIRKDWEKLKRG